MVYGTIQDFYTASSGVEKSVIKILVRGEGEEENTCTVCAEIPNDALKFNMVQAGSSICWQDPNVYITIEGVDDIPFKKVGKSSGDATTFYEHLKIMKELQRGRGIKE